MSRMERIAQPGVAQARRARGVTACSAGRMGEDSVQRDYLARGYAQVASRWRGQSGEIDLILQRGDEFIFVEVKKSSRHHYAAQRIDRRQMDRICRAALEFCGGLASGLLTLMRFDAALVDQFGRVQIIENAFDMA